MERWERNSRRSSVRAGVLAVALALSLLPALGFLGGCVEDVGRPLTTATAIAAPAPPTQPASSTPVHDATLTVVAGATPNPVSSAVLTVVAPTPAPTAAPSVAASTATPEASPTIAPRSTATFAADSGAAAAAEPGGGPVDTSSEAVPTPRPVAAQGVRSPQSDGTPGAAGPRTRVVALDPGHGGPEPGASAGGLAEKDVNLKIALKLADLLRDRGYRVVLTRDSDVAVSPDYKGGGYPGGVVRDLQARVDIANAESADLFISIHNNGSGDPGESGTEVWYNQQRSFAERNLALARLVHEGLLKRIRALGYAVFDRGIKDDSNFRVFQGRVFNIFVLGPGDGPRPHEATRMPAVLGESLFISNPRDAAMLRQERTLDAIAAGYHDAVVAYFERFL